MSSSHLSVKVTGLGLCQMIEAPLLKLEEICRQEKVMVVIARSYGLVGLVRISIRVSKPGYDSFSPAHFHFCLS
jgi:hypothetical protein